jgi:hypothetical protein
METLIHSLFIENWQRKLVALAVALVVWLFVNYSITATKTIPGVPIRIINIPTDKTIQGLLPNGILNKRIALTLSGSKDVIKELEPGDLEVLIDASTIDRDDWVLLLTKKNLVSLSPDIDLAHSISNVSHTEFILKMSRVITAKIPITIEKPVGEIPPGYELLDIWPQKLTQTLSGPEEAILSLKARGLSLTFDLSEITKSELDSLHSDLLDDENDEISFYVPNHWKEVAIPFHNNALEEINDPEAQHLRIDFLRKEYNYIGKEIPIRIFFPLKYINDINPLKYKLAVDEKVTEKNGINILNQKLQAFGVSKLFLEIVKSHLEIIIVAAPKNEREILEWGAEVVAAEALEDTYVAYFMNDLKQADSVQGVPLPNHLQETMLRKRFKHYLEQISLYTTPDQPLDVDSFIEGNLIKVKS